MIVLGLTGSIGMGKSKAAAALRRLGLPMHDSDAEVHRLLSTDSAAVAAVAAAFPGVVRDGAVDRGELGRRVFADPAALQRLEAILHPLVRRAQRRFLARAAAARRPLVVLDIPLLFETGAQRNCDAIVAMTAPRFVQLARLRRRPGMTAQRLAGVEARQTPDLEKRRRADFVVPTGLNRRTSLRALTRIVRVLRRTGRGCRDA
ncbi:MAG TPA: dephospho-CoA kinase [Dongiaceae bacterium]|nr:dephospho-CoA kinase [Dongiaceae bacterium]